MTAASLHAELTGRGARLSVAPTPQSGPLPPLRLRVQAPAGALTLGLKAAIERHRPDLLDFVFELAERAALHLERDDASPAEWEEAERFARVYVRGGGARADAALRDLAEHHPTVKAAADKFCGVEIVGLRHTPADSSPSRAFCYVCHTSAEHDCPNLPPYPAAESEAA